MKLQGSEARKAFCGMAYHRPAVCARGRGFRPSAISPTVEKPTQEKMQVPFKLQRPCFDSANRMGQQPSYGGRDAFSSHLMPGPWNVLQSSGSDFIDLIGMDSREAHHRLQDAMTFQLLGCSTGVLRQAEVAVLPISQCTFNVKRLKAFRDNVVRNLAPTVARGFVKAQRSSLTAAFVAAAAPLLHGHSHGNTAKSSSSSFLQPGLQDGPQGKGSSCLSSPPAASALPHHPFRMSSLSAGPGPLSPGDLPGLHSRPSALKAATHSAADASTMEDATAGSPYAFWLASVPSPRDVPAGAGAEAIGQWESSILTPDPASPEAGPLPVDESPVALTAPDPPPPLPAALVPLDEDDVADLLPQRSGGVEARRPRRRRGGRSSRLLEGAGRRGLDCSDTGEGLSAAWV